MADADCGDADLLGVWLYAEGSSGRFDMGAGFWGGVAAGFGAVEGDEAWEGLMRRRQPKEGTMFGWITAIAAICAVGAGAWWIYRDVKRTLWWEEYSEKEQALLDGERARNVADEDMRRREYARSWLGEG